jgi:hypothetical protein
VQALSSRPSAAAAASDLTGEVRRRARVVFMGSCSDGVARWTDRDGEDGVVDDDGDDGPRSVVTTGPPA